MRNVIKFNGRLYAMLEEGAHTIQGEIVHVVASKSKLNKTLETIGHKCPTHEAWYELISEIAKRVKCLPSYFPDDNGHILKAIDSFSQPDSRECCNCEYHLTKKANDEVIVRDEMLLKMREGFQMILDRRNMKADDYYAKYPEYRKSIINDASPYGGEYQTAKYFLALPLPATTLRLEAERKVIEAAHKAVEHINLLRPEYRELNDAIAHLDSLGGGK